MEALRFVLLLCVVGGALGDMYLHTPRGSNNRLDEANRDRANGNRLFDSQNNNRGGYNVGSYTFLEDETVGVSWTNQHGCGGNPNTPECEVILQMMCDRNARDGTTTQRIPETEESDIDPRFGRHESFYYYQTCKTTERNQGLFTASQNLNGNSAIHTRQNPGGTRRGFECPEERDYYPYWRASPWMDVTVFTNNLSRCAMYQEESQNVKSRWHCTWTPPEGTVLNETTVEAARSNAELRQNGNQLSPITSEKCTAQGGYWVEDPAWGIPPPTCERGIYTRDNHLGYTDTGIQPTSEQQMAAFSRMASNFTTGLNANFSNTNCWLRARYNITTADYDGWNTFSDKNDRGGEALGLTAQLGYQANFENNPQVTPIPGVTLQLAINTAQYGRTFQDRTHRMAVTEREEGFEDVSIKSLTVQGKRGNIVQVFPATEYIYSPQDMEITTQDYIHFQWTGSNTNPNNNDGQGQNGSDRSNAVAITDPANVYPAMDQLETGWLNGDDFQMKAFGLCRSGGYAGEISELDDLPTFCNPTWSFGQERGLIRFQKAGDYHYMCTRNNNFSNRAQKGTIVVRDADAPLGEESQDIGFVVGGIASGVVVSVLVGFAIISLGKSMGASAAAAAAKPI